MALFYPIGYYSVILEYLQNELMRSICRNVNTDF